MPLQEVPPLRLHGDRRAQQAVVREARVGAGPWEGSEVQSLGSSSVVHSGLATEKGRARRGMGKADRLVDAPAMGGWGIIRMSGWVGQEGYGWLWVSACQNLRPCLPSVYKLPHPDTYAFEGYIQLSGNPAPCLAMSVFSLSRLAV